MFSSFGSLIYMLTIVCEINPWWRIRPSSLTLPPLLSFSPIVVDVVVVGDVADVVVAVVGGPHLCRKISLGLQFHFDLNRLRSVRNSGSRVQMLTDRPGITLTHHLETHPLSTSLVGSQSGSLGAPTTPTPVRSLVSLSTC